MLIHLTGNGILSGNFILAIESDTVDLCGVMVFFLALIFLVYLYRR